MESIFNNLSVADVVLYLVSGYIFLSIINFITQRNNEKGNKSIWIKSLVVGYVFVHIYSVEPEPFKTSFEIVVFMFFVVICAYFIGKFCNSNSMRTVLRFLKISSVFDETVWEYLRDRKKPVWIQLSNTEKNIKILGMWEYTEGVGRKPIITLIRYEITCLNNAEKFDYDNQLERKILVDTSQYDIIEFIYDEASDNILKQNE